LNAADAIDIARDAIIVALKLGAPIMLLALAIGLVVSLFQALTQIQEATLAFVPKVLVIFTVFLLSMPFMLSTLISFTHELAGRIAGLH
jgi:flagellar biosynthetic protein FliQ